MIRGTRGPVAEKVKVQALESLARGKALDTRQREALRALGIEPREPIHATREREWSEGARTLLWRLLTRGWTVVAIAAFCLRTPESVADEVVRCGWRENFPDAFLHLRRRRRRPAGEERTRGRRARGVPA